MEEARTMSALSPVARIDRPSRVRKKRTTNRAATRRITASTTSSCHLAHHSQGKSSLHSVNRESLP